MFAVAPISNVEARIGSIRQRVDPGSVAAESASGSFDAAYLTAVAAPPSLEGFDPFGATYQQAVDAAKSSAAAAATVPPGPVPGSASARSAASARCQCRTRSPRTATASCRPRPCSRSGRVAIVWWRLRQTPGRGMRAARQAPRPLLSRRSSSGLVKFCDPGRWTHHRSTIDVHRHTAVGAHAQCLSQAVEQQRPHRHQGNRTQVPA